METFKIVERETKTKAYSKEGLCSISGGFFSGFLYHPRASGSGSFLLAVIYTGTTKMPHFVIFEATFSKFSGN